MYFGGNDEINKYSRLDIDGDNDIVRLNGHEMDNKSKKNIATYLRNKVSILKFVFNKGIPINSDKKLEITIVDKSINTDKKFKNSYKNICLIINIENGESSYYLREGYRWLSLDESNHIIDLIHKSDNITYYINVDLWSKE